MYHHEHSIAPPTGILPLLMLYMMRHTCQWSMPHWPVTSLVLPLLKGVNTGGNLMDAEALSHDCKLLTLSLTFRQLELVDSGCLSICVCCTILDSAHSAWLVLSVSKAALTIIISDTEQIFSLNIDTPFPHYVLFLLPCLAGYFWWWNEAQEFFWFGHIWTENSIWRWPNIYFCHCNSDMSLGIFAPLLIGTLLLWPIPTCSSAGVRWQVQLW